MKMLFDDRDLIVAYVSDWAQARKWFHKIWPPVAEEGEDGYLENGEEIGHTAWFGPPKVVRVQTDVQEPIYRGKGPEPVGFVDARVRICTTRERRWLGSSAAPEPGAPWVRNASAESSTVRQVYEIHIFVEPKARPACEILRRIHAAGRARDRDGVDGYAAIVAMDFDLPRVVLRVMEQECWPERLGDEYKEWIAAELRGSTAVENAAE